MKWNRIPRVLAALLAFASLPSVAFAAKIGEDTLILGKPGSSSNKVIQESVSKKAFLRYNESTNKAEYSDDGTSFTAFSTGVTSPTDIYNLGCKASVSGNALTIALSQSDGSTDPASGAGAVKVGFRNATSATGGYTQVSVTGALSATIPSGQTLGFSNGVAHYIYVYLINNGGTAEIAVSGSRVVDGGTVVTTSAISGASTLTGIYSTTVRSNVPARLICRMQATEATAGTWATAPSEISVVPFDRGSVYSGSSSDIRIETVNFRCHSSGATVNSQSGSWVSSVTSGGSAGTCTVNFASGVFSSAPICVASSTSTSTRYCSTNTPTTSSVNVTHTVTTTQDDGNCSMICFGAR